MKVFDFVMNRLQYAVFPILSAVRLSGAERGFAVCVTKLRYEVDG
jgi:hypothetical protein